MASGAKYLPGGGPGTVPQWFGIYYGYIAVNVDPTATGRVKVRVPQVFGSATSGWASPLVPISYIPAVGKSVLVMFVGGDPSQPVWSGNFAVAGGAAGIVISATAPASPEIGEVWVATATGLMSEWNGASWIAYQIGGAAIQTGVGLTAPNITGGVITGSQFIADGTSGEFLGYTGTPAAGNMNVSISPVGGTDSWTNAFFDGVTVYYQNSYIQMHVNSSGPYPAIELASGLGSEADHPAIYVQPSNAGAANEAERLIVTGPGSSHDGAQPSIILAGSAKNGSTGAGISISNGWMTGNVPLVMTDTSNLSVPTNSSSTLITPNYSIPGGDAKAGTMYRWTILCQGTQAGASTPFLAFSASAFGVSSYGSINMSTAGIPAGDIYDCIVEAWIQVLTPGSSGTANFTVRVSISPYQAAAQSTVTNSLTATGTDTLVTVNTTASAGMNIQAAIGSAASGGLHSYSSTLERLGP